MYALELSNVSKDFGGLNAVREVNLSLAHGERRALIGPNGAGKSTLFNLIAGDLPVTNGCIKIFNQDVTKIPVHQRIDLGLRRTYQTSALFDTLSVRENIFLSVLGPERMQHYRFLGSVRKDKLRMERVEEVAKMVGLADRLKNKAGDLSHGERRQLEIGLAVSFEPKLVMLDEPAAGLSPDEREMIKKLIRELPKDVTLLLIEHDMDVALSLSEKVTVLHKGKIVAEGTPNEISSNSMVQRIYLGGALND